MTDPQHPVGNVLGNVYTVQPIFCGHHWDRSICVLFKEVSTFQRYFCTLKLLLGFPLVIIEVSRVSWLELVPLYWGIGYATQFIKPIKIIITAQRSGCRSIMWYNWTKLVLNQLSWLLVRFQLTRQFSEMPDTIFITWSAGPELWY